MPIWAPVDGPALVADTADVWLILTDAKSHILRAPKCLIDTCGSLWGVPVASGCWPVGS